MGLIKISVTKKRIVQMIILCVFLSILNPQDVNASENLSGNDFIKDVEMNEFDGSKMKELNLGMMARLYYTLSIPKNVTITAGDKIDIDLPDQIEAIHKERVPVYSKKNKVGEITGLGTE